MWSSSHSVVRDALLGVLGDLARGAEVHVADGVVSVRLPGVPAMAEAEAERLMVKAAMRPQRGEFAKAEGICRRVLELNPGHMKAQRELAMVLVEMGRPEDAVDVLVDVLRADPHDAEALVILGNHYARRGGDPETARKFLKRAAEISPEDPLAHNSLAALRFEAKQPAEALMEFDRALALDPDFGHARYGKPMVLMTEGRFVEARDALDGAGRLRSARVAALRSGRMGADERDVRARRLLRAGDPRAVPRHHALLRPAL